MNKPTLTEQIDWIKEMRESHEEWLKVVDGNLDILEVHIDAAKNEIEILKAIQENLIALRFHEAAQTREKILDEPFDPKRIDEVFENIKRDEKRNTILTKENYSIYGRGGFHGHIDFGKNEVYYFRDNFPGQKVYVRSDLKIRTWGDFISDLKRVGFTEINLKAFAQPWPSFPPAKQEVIK
jgi:restriction endonuclease S subunit